MSHSILFAGASVEQPALARSSGPLSDGMWTAGSPAARGKAFRLGAISLVLSVLALGCDGTDPASSSDGDGSSNGNGSCVPRTCSAVDASCGSMPDGCGDTLQCGSCSDDHFCNLSYECQAQHDDCPDVAQCATGQTCGRDPLCGLIECGACDDSETCGSEGVCKPTESGGTTGSVAPKFNPDCSKPLNERIVTWKVPIDTPPTVSQKRLAGTQLILTPLAEGGALLGWTGEPVRNDTYEVHVTRINDQGERVGDDVVLKDPHIRGLVADSSGFTVFHNRNRPLEGANNVIFQIPNHTALTRVTHAGEVEFSKQFYTSVGGRMVSKLSHGRLVSTNSGYAAFIDVQLGNGHKADALLMFDKQGELVSTKEKICSHNYATRLATDGNTVATACHGDYTPPGVNLMGELLVKDESGQLSHPRGQAPRFSVVGGLAERNGEYFLSFSGKGDRASMDIGLARKKVGSDASITWITNTPNDNEIDPQMARYGDNFLVGWYAGTEAPRTDRGYFSGGTPHLAVVTPEGEIIEGPVKVDMDFFASGDFATFPNGDVGWIRGDDQVKTLEVFRVAACQ